MQKLFLLIVLLLSFKSHSQDHINASISTLNAKFLAIDSAEIRREVKKLSSDSLKQDYLENIFYDDQNVRVLQEEVLMAQLTESYKEVDELIYHIDSCLMLRIKNYLELFGYPAKAKLGEIAAMTPCLIIHHSPSKSNYRILYYPILKKAFIEGNIAESFFEMYLNRTLMFIEAIDYDEGKVFDINGLIQKMDRYYGVNIKSWGLCK